MVLPYLKGLINKEKHFHVIIGSILLFLGIFVFSYICRSDLTEYQINTLVSDE